MKKIWLLGFALALACNGPPPNPCADAPTTWPECESTGGTWYVAGDFCECECPSSQYFQEDVGCQCPEGTEWVESEGWCLPYRVDTPPDPKRLVGITAFALPLHDREYIEKVCAHIKSHGYNTLRVGFETWRWDGQPYLETFSNFRDYSIGKAMAATRYLPKGPRYDSEENLNNIRRLLDVTARIPEIWIELIPVFTIKGLSDPDTPQMRREATNLARRLVLDGDYKHVFFSYTNEWWHSGGVGSRISRDEVIGGLKRLKAARRLVTTDDKGSHGEGDRWDAKYPREFLPYVDMVAFHPRRNPNPSEWDLSLGVARYVIREGKEACLYNETVCYASDEELDRFPWLKGAFQIANMGRPPESLRKQIIIDYMGRVRSAGGIWYYHCIACFMGSTEFEEFWIPEWGG